MNIFNAKNRLLPYCATLKFICSGLTQHLQPLLNEKFAAKYNTSPVCNAKSKSNERFDPKNKNVVYVGGFGGIGFQACKIFASKGIANLVILELKKNKSRLKELENEFPDVCTMYQHIDLTDKCSIEKCFKKVIEKIQCIDVLVNGSGVLDEREVELMVDVNLTGLMNSCLIAYPLMDKSLDGRGGVICNIASVLGLEPCAPLAAYTGSKHGVIGFTRSLADETYYKRTGVTVFAVCPGITDTPLFDDHIDKGTFSYSKDLMLRFAASKKQAPEQCAANLVKAVEINKNGAICILNLGKMCEAEMQVLWQPEDP